MSDRPNILILMTDQQRADCLSCAGHDIVKTPNMDALADEGVRFTGAHTTSPICMPARSSFLSGLYCHNHGQWGNYSRLADNADTYLHHVKTVGYHTCHIGKSHLYPHGKGRHLNEDLPFMHSLGWNDILETTGPHATCATDSIMTDHWREIGCLDTFRKDYAERAKHGGTATWPSPMPEGEHLDDFVGRTAVEYINGYTRNEPLLLFVGFGGPHEPWDPPEAWARQYDPAAMDLPKPATAPGPGVPKEAAEHQRCLQDPDKKLSDDVYKKIRALYYAKISHADWWFGNIIDAFKKKGLWNNTTVIFWSDHGEMLGDKHRFYKSVFYEESVRVPFIIRDPARAAKGRVSNALISLTDAFPTILDMAGCPPKDDAFGKSLVPLLAKPEKKFHDAVFSEIDDRTMIRDERYKMVADSSGTILKLYDLIEDPSETVNLIGKEEHESTAASLRNKMLDWHLRTQLRRR